MKTEIRQPGVMCATCEFLDLNPLQQQILETGMRLDFIACEHMLCMITEDFDHTSFKERKRKKKIQLTRIERRIPKLNDKHHNHYANETDNAHVITGKEIQVEMILREEPAMFSQWGCSSVLSK